MNADERLENATLAASFIPVLGNILYRPILGVQQTLLLLTGLGMVLHATPIFEATGWVLMAGAWIWSLLTLEAAYRSRRPRRHA